MNKRQGVAALLIAGIVLLGIVVCFVCLNRGSSPGPATKGVDRPSRDRVPDLNEPEAKTTDRWPDKGEKTETREDDDAGLPQSPDVVKAAKEPRPASTPDDGLRIFGRFCGPFGDGLAQVLLRLSRSGNVIASTLTGPEGCFEFRGLSSGAHAVSVSGSFLWFDIPFLRESGMLPPTAPDTAGAPESRPPGTWIIEAGGPEVRLALEPPCGVLGRVVESLTGNPVPRFQLTFAGRRQAHTWWIDDRQGRFLLMFPTAVQLSLSARTRAEATEHETPIQVLDGVVVRDVTLRLVTGGVVVGKIRHRSGKRIRGCLVRVESEETGKMLTVSTSFDVESSQYRVEGLPDGLVRLVVSTFDYPKAVVRRVQIVRGKKAVRDMVVDDGATIRVRVVDQAGNPVAKARISIKNHDTGEDHSVGLQMAKGKLISTSYMTNDGGTFESSVLPGGACSVSVTTAGGVASKNAQLLPGRTCELRFTLPVTR